MAFTSRGRRLAYDNIAAGSVAGVERTNTDTVSKFEQIGGGRFTSTSTGDEDNQGHTNVAAGASVSNTVPEQVKVAGSADGDERVDASS